ncbi:hypothetical protein O3M35_004157 [Rhynocoris fuscipes]|uniref:Ig-like domain-containing protein n=1 Tax=Rhynocoris fuscipes TaxID=488301 RepID=A0AAW1CKX2_9HEMI
MSLIGLATAVAMLLVAESGTGAQEASDWSNCVGKCKCKWVSGRKTAECSNADLTSIPDTLSPEIQHVNLSKNSFVKLQADAFKSVGLVHLHKIYLRECKIRDINKDAFRGLQILIELDLSENNILTLHPGTFRDNIRLRLLYLNHNPIQKLEDGLFANMTFLQTVDFRECELSHIGYRTFTNVSSLNHLLLDGNKLTHLKLSVVEKLVKLRSLGLIRNPWRCDCYLRAFRDWVIERNLYVQGTSCVEPMRLQDKNWNEISSEKFACKPQIIYPPVGTEIRATSEDVTLSCKVAGNPLPKVNWFFNSVIITNDTKTKYGDLRYTITSSGDTTRWINITVNRVRSKDHGEFRCVAESPGGIDERKVSLIVDNSGLDGFYSGGNGTSDSWPLLIGLITGFVALLIIAIICFCCLCRKCQNDSLSPLHHGKKSPGNGLSPNGEISRHPSGTNDQEKSLLAVNPVQKPPRRYESQISPAGGAELSELNRNLLDDGSIIAGGNDDDRSVESLDDIPLKSREKLDTEYPPDLIAFPGRGRQNNVSPGSSTSTALQGDGNTPGSRHPLVGSPPPILHSPLYQQFGTLPYARAGSPYSVSGLGSAAKPGYVTIPRRPRVPSWTGSAPPTSCILDQSTDINLPQPVYDNLGPRTTADGSSVLSLNKTDNEVGTQPRRRQSHEPARPFSPLSPPAYVPDDLRRWGTISTTTPLRRSGSADGQFIPLHSSTLQHPSKAIKVAPKPPPKPIKVTNTSQGPLYEDEGEDGTEV